MVSVLIGSSALSTLLSSWLNRKNEKQTREFNYQERLEARMEKLEHRLDRFEMRDTVYSSATACANACANADGCPVLAYLQDHPVPEKEV